MIQTRSGCSRLNVIPSETRILIAEVYTSCFIQDGGGQGLACVIKYGSVAKPPHPNLPPRKGEGTFSMLKADCCQLPATRYFASVYLDNDRSSLGGFMCEPRMV